MTGLLVQGDWSPILNVFFVLICLSLVLEMTSSPHCAVSAPVLTREMRIDVIRSEPHTLSLKHFKFVPTDSLIFSAAKFFYQVL